MLKMYYIFPPTIKTISLPDIFFDKVKAQKLKQW